MEQATTRRGPVNALGEPMLPPSEYDWTWGDVQMLISDAPFYVACQKLISLLHLDNETAAAWVKEVRRRERKALGI